MASTGDQWLNLTVITGTEDNVRTVQHQLAFRSEPYSLTFVTAGSDAQDSAQSTRRTATGEHYMA